MSNDHDVDVVLVGPKKSTFKGFGDDLIYEPKEFTRGKLKLRLIDMSQKKYLLNDWISFDLFRLLKKEKPDFIYIVGMEVEWVNFICFFYKIVTRKFCKMALFSM